MSEPDNTAQGACPVCGGRGWHTAGGNDPMACGRCEAGAAFDGEVFDDYRVVVCEDTGTLAEDGVCPVHEGDACLVIPGAYVGEVRRLRERLARLEPIVQHIAGMSERFECVLIPRQMVRDAKDALGVPPDPARQLEGT